MITQDRLKQLVHYNPDTGIFTHLQTSRNKLKVAGTVAGYPTKSGHLVFNIGNIKYYCHRLAWLYMTGSLPTNDIDHINCNPTDNRFVNLRDVTRGENLQNLIRPHKDNQSKYLGVSKTKNNKWCAQITIKGIKKTKSGFNTPQEAHDYYISLKREHHPKGTL